MSASNHAIADVQSFVAQSRAIRSPDDLGGLLDDFTREIGFNHYALGHHVDFRTSPAGALQLTNYPTGWIEQYIDHGLYLDDPVHVASYKTAVGFRWDEIPSLIDMNANHHRMLEAGRARGMTNGFTVPVHIPGEYFGTASFTVGDADRLRPEAFQMAQLSGAFAFEAARRIMRLRNGYERPILTQRQVECLTLVAKGKTDWEIAKILGIAKRTATQHIELARERYGVANRTSLVVHALFDLQINFTDALGSR